MAPAASRNNADFKNSHDALKVSLPIFYLFYFVTGIFHKSQKDIKQSCQVTLDISGNPIYFHFGFPEMSRKTLGMILVLLGTKEAD